MPLSLPSPRSWEPGTDDTGDEGSDLGAKRRNDWLVQQFSSPSLSAIRHIGFSQTAGPLREGSPTHPVAHRCVASTGSRRRFPRPRTALPPATKSSLLNAHRSADRSRPAAQRVSSTSVERSPPTTSCSTPRPARSGCPRRRRASRCASVRGGRRCIARCTCASRPPAQPCRSGHGAEEEEEGPSSRYRAAGWTHIGMPDRDQVATRKSVSFIARLRTGSRAAYSGLDAQRRACASSGNSSST